MSAHPFVQSTIAARNRLASRAETHAFALYADCHRATMGAVIDTQAARERVTLLLAALDALDAADAKIDALAALDGDAAE